MSWSFSLIYIFLVNYFKYSYFLLIGAKKQRNIKVDRVENEFICLYLVSLFLFDMLIHNYFLCCSMHSISSSNISLKKQNKRKLKSLSGYNINDSNCISSRYQLHITNTFHTSLSQIAPDRVENLSSYLYSVFSQISSILPFSYA